MFALYVLKIAARQSNILKQLFERSTKLSAQGVCNMTLFCRTGWHNPPTTLTIKQMKIVTALGIVCNLMKHTRTKTLIVRNGKPKQYLSHERDLLDSLYVVNFVKTVFGLHTKCCNMQLYCWIECKLTWLVDCYVRHHITYVNWLCLAYSTYNMSIFHNDSF